MLHKNSSLGNIHIIVNWEVADAAALNALVLFPYDIYKVVYQIDEDKLLLLIDNVVPTWKDLGGGSAGVTDHTMLTNIGTLSHDALEDAIDDLVVAVGTKGYLEIPQNSKSAAYTTILSDSGKHLFHPSSDATPRTFTIDSNANVAYPLGTAITFINDDSAGDITIAITSDTMKLAGDGSTGSRTLVANGIATAIKTKATEWIISGVGLT